MYNELDWLTCYKDYNEFVALAFDRNIIIIYILYVPIFLDNTVFFVHVCVHC